MNDKKYSLSNSIGDGIGMFKEANQIVSQHYKISLHEIR